MITIEICQPKGNKEAGFFPVNGVYSGFYSRISRVRKNVIKNVPIRPVTGI
jgi:hypothetical protein